MRPYRKTFLEEIFFCQVAPVMSPICLKRPVNYDNVVRKLALKLFSLKESNRCPQLLRWNINSIDILSWYHNFVDDFLSRNDQKIFLLKKTESYDVYMLSFWELNVIFLRKDWILEFFSIQFLFQRSVWLPGFPTRILPRFLRIPG